MLVRLTGARGNLSAAGFARMAATGLSESHSPP